MTISPVRKSSRPVRDTTRDHEWINEHIDEFRGQWVMVYECQLIAADPNVRQLLNKVPRGAYPEAVVTYVLTEEEAQRVYLDNSWPRLLS
jgi:hypothetical protein